MTKTILPGYRPMSRRRFVESLLLMGISAPAAGIGNTPVYFRHGIASGDPLQDRVILWTRISQPDLFDLRVRWEVAADASFKHIIRKGVTTTGAHRDYTVKTDVTGLQPGTHYYYRFCYKGQYSATGRTQTLPAALHANSFQMAVVACNNWEDGYFNAYRFLAQKQEVNLVLHLGDYIYEYQSGEYGDTSIGRINEPLHETVTLQDYRQRYAQYHTDPDLQLLHAAKPFILVWDDHELANDAYTDGAQNHQATEGNWNNRKAAATQAWFEWLPVRANTKEEICRSIQIGNDIELLLFDERLSGRTLQMKPTDAGFYSPDRSMLGQHQLPFLLDRLANSPAKWKLIGNQVMFTGYAANPAFKQPKYSDWWLGYPAERQQIMDCLAAHAVSGTVFLTGDHHQSFVLALHNEETLFTYRTPYTQKPLAWEFLTPSITSKNGDRLPAQEISAAEAMLQQAQTNPHLVFADIKSHGYYIATINNEALEATYYYVDTLRNRDAKEYRAASFRINRENFLLHQDRDSVNR